MLFALQKNFLGALKLGGLRPDGVPYGFTGLHRVGGRGLKV